MRFSKVLLNGQSFLVPRPTELERNHRHITATAKALGLERSHLYKKCQQLGIDLKAE